MKAAKLSLLNPRFWLKTVTLACVIAFGLVWWYSLYVNLNYSGHFYVGMKELNEAIALGEGVLFLVAAVWAVVWLAQELKEYLKDIKI